jgi:hypothetical protein
MAIRLVPLLLFCLAARAGFADEFEKYPSEGQLAAKPARPILDTKKKRNYRTVLRTAASEGANFNGHYRIAYWGCGTNCISWAVIDLSGGKVWMAPRAVASCWPNNATTPPSQDIPDWFQFSVASSLIYAYECNDDSGRFTFNLRKIFQWKNGKPVLLRTENVAF